MENNEMMQFLYCKYPVLGKFLYWIYTLKYKNLTIIFAGLKTTKYF